MGLVRLRGHIGPLLRGTSSHRYLGLVAVRVQRDLLVDGLELSSLSLPGEVHA
ncbi:hypothetical protein ACWD4T_14240 [Streptomyces umbrinus]